MRNINPSSDLKDARILVVDDDQAIVRPLRRMLCKAGYTDVEVSTDPSTAVELFRARRPDLLILDLHMPERSGFEVMVDLQAEIPPGDYIPIVMITGDDDPETQHAALAHGVQDFLTKPFEAVTVLLRIRNLLEIQRVRRALRAEKDNLEQRVTARTKALAEAQVEILRRLALAAEYRDDVTGHHAERVGVLSALIASALGLEEGVVRLIRRAAPLHDVGKIGIPDAILMKPGPLTSAEFEVMKSHTVIGGRILSGSNFEVLKVAQSIALSHHERWDGTGYTFGRAGNDIPISGRIVAVADVFDSLCHERPYKPGRPPAEAIEMIRQSSGSHFDPQVVQAFLSVVNDHSVIDIETLIASAPGLTTVPTPAVATRPQLA